MKSYFSTLDKSLCSGCAACQQSCPFDALVMKPDEEGFLFPSKIAERCTDCGLCERVCPFPKPDYSNQIEPEGYASYVRDLDERCQSSSGAIFYAIAKRILDKGGIVYGATIDGRMQVYHKGVECVEGLQDLRGSKYVQSATRDVFREIRFYLNNGRTVYYSGTGCQVAGLKAFLRKEYINLVTSDIVCHGVPPQRLFDMHIHYLENRYDGRVEKYMFRDPAKRGGCEIAEIVDSKKTGERHTYVRPSYILSPYLYGFIKGMTLRYSCYNCPYAHIPRQGDITLADCWGVKQLAPDFNPDHGVSLALINSGSGRRVWSEIVNGIDFRKIDMTRAVKWNGCVWKPSVMPKIRPAVFGMIIDKGYEEAASTIFRPSVKEVVVMYMKKYVKIILGRRMIKFLNL